MTMTTIAVLFELAGKVAFAERRRDFEQKKLREQKEQTKPNDAQLRMRQASLEAREREVEALSPELDAHNGAVDWVGGLPDALWEKIAGLLDEEEAAFPFARTCRRFRKMQKRVSSIRGKAGLCSKVDTGLLKIPSTVSGDWCEWVFDETERGKRTFKEELGKLAAFNGHLHVLRSWEDEKPGFQRNFGTDVCA